MKRSRAATASKPLLLAWSADDPAVQPLWQALNDFGAEIGLTGHNHNYQRFAPLNANGALDLANGVREFVVGSGGRSHYNFASPMANTEAYDYTSYGVLKLTLHENSYDFEFVPEAGKTFTDRGNGIPCH